MEQEKKDRYMVKWDGIEPTLIRLDSTDGMKVFRLEKWEQCSDLAWVYEPELDGIPDHPERFPEYMEITENEASEVKRQIEAKSEEIEKELRRTCIKRSRKKTAEGMADVLTFRKVSQWKSFSLKEYMEILLRQLSKKDVTLQRIDYSWYDEWGYLKCRGITKKADIWQLTKDCPDQIEAWFSDTKNKYVLRTPFLMYSIELEAVPKKKKAGAEGDAPQ